MEKHALPFPFPLWAHFSSISQCSNHGGIAGFHLQRQPSPAHASLAVNKEKKEAKSFLSGQTIFLASIISSFRAPAYPKFRSVDPFPALHVRRESSNRCSIAWLGDSFLNRGRESRGGKKRARNSLLQCCENCALYIGEFLELVVSTGSPTIKESLRVFRGFIGLLL
jgi:hypothetical protein